MFYTVFSTNDCDYMHWQSELLEFSWKQVGQQGELIRLVATHTPEKLPIHKYARSVATQCWDIHPETGDHYPIYNKPASLLEWAFREKPAGTVLFIDPDCVFRQPVTQQVAPGFPISQRWHDFAVAEPSKANPFGIGERFAFLNDYCARVDLKADAVMIPTLIHTRDLRRISARWLELCRAIRDNSEDGDGRKMWESDMFSYLAVCAEYGLIHRGVDLGVATNWDPDAVPNTPLIHYCQPIFDIEGRELFNKHSYRPWTVIDDQVDARHYYGRDLVEIINGHVCALAGVEPKISRKSRPERRQNVKEGFVLDQILLEVPEEGLGVWLNHTGLAIWQLCDGFRTVDEVCKTLGERYDADVETIRKDVLATLNHLKASGLLLVR